MSHLGITADAVMACRMVIAWYDHDRTTDMSDEMEVAPDGSSLEPGFVSKAREVLALAEKMPDLQRFAVSVRETGGVVIEPGVVQP